MKNNITFLLALVCTIIFIKANAQNLTITNNGKEITIVKDTIAKLTVFTAKYVEGKTYLHWEVVEQQCNGLYIIYRSLDNKTYDVIGCKQGIGVPVCFPIAYYFADEKPIDGISYYKVVHYSTDKTYLATPERVIEIDRTISFNK